MPRGPRLDAPGALHHVIARGIERSRIFVHDPDRQVFLEQLCQRVGARCRVAPAEIRSASLRRPAVAARALVCHLAVTHYGLSLTATARALTISEQSVLRGVSTGERVLAAAGCPDLLPR